MPDTLPSLVVSPKDLHFEGSSSGPDAFVSQIPRHLALTNPSRDRDVTFKIKTTAPRRYYVRPNAGLLLANSSDTVEVVLQPQIPLPVEEDRRDKFLIQVAWMDDPAVAAGSDISEWWRAKGQTGKNKEDWKEIRLKSILSLPSADPSQSAPTERATFADQAAAEAAAAEVEMQTLQREMSVLKQENADLRAAVAVGSASGDSGGDEGKQVEELRAKFVAERATLQSELQEQKAKVAQLQGAPKQGGAAGGSTDVRLYVLMSLVVLLLAVVGKLMSDAARLGPSVRISSGASDL